MGRDVPLHRGWPEDAIRDMGNVGPGGNLWTLCYRTYTEPLFMARLFSVIENNHQAGALVKCSILSAQCTQYIAEPTHALVKMRRYILIILMGQILHLCKSVEPVPLSTMRLQVQS